MKRQTRCHPVALQAFTVLVIMVAACNPTSSPSGENPPVANAGLDQNVTGSQEVTLDAGSSTDPDGGGLSFTWIQTAGPTVSLQGAGSERTFSAPNTNSTLRFAVEVFDSTGLSSLDTVDITVTAVGNLPPVASAGFDKQVQGADLVLLDGANSIDPEDGVLRYSWIQVSGPPVELFDAENLLASFVAPNDNTELQFQLTVTDEEEQSDTDDLIISVTAVSTLLLAVNQIGTSVAIFAEPGSADGNVAPDTALSGDATGLDTPRDVVATRAGSVIIANSGNDSLLRYLNTESMAGNASPPQVVQGPGTGLDQPASLAYSDSFDVVFVLNIGAKTDIVAFAGPTRVVFDGDLAPLLTFPSSELNAPSNIFLDHNDRLYVANTGASNLLVFQQAVQGGAAVELGRTITSPAFISPVDMYVDSSDHLLVVDSDARVLLFNDASGLDGDVEPYATVTISGARFLTSIALDADGTAYLADVDANAIYVIDDIVTVSGTRSPDRTIVGASTTLSRPVRLFVSEP